MDLKELQSGVDPSIHWYYQSKKKPLFKYIEKVFKEVNSPLTIVDFGAGSGFFSLELLEAFPYAIDKVLLVDIGYSQQELDESAGKKVVKLHKIPHGIENCVVLMMDVLEHIEDDYGVLKSIKNQVSKNSFYFITVPAFMSLWSPHDVYLEHYRRYTQTTLKKLIDAQELAITSHYYIYPTLFIAAYFIRKIKNLLLSKEKKENPSNSDMRPVHPIVNSLLKNYCLTEMRIRRSNRIFGLSVVSEGKIN